MILSRATQPQKKMIHFALLAQVTLGPGLAGPLDGSIENEGRKRVKRRQRRRYNVQNGLARSVRVSTDAGGVVVVVVIDIVF